LNNNYSSLTNIYSKSYRARSFPAIKVIIASSKKAMNIILAKNMAELPNLENPKTAATITIAKNATAQRNIFSSPDCRKTGLILSSFTIYLPIFSICCPALFISVPAPLVALHPKAETIKNKTASINNENFFILFSFYVQT